MDRRPEIDTSRSRYSLPPSSNISPFRSRSPSLSPSPPFNTQNRRLQLRNARFRGALLASASASAPASSPRQLSPPQSQIETWRSALGGIDDEGEDKENEFDYVGSTRGTGYEGLHTIANTSTSHTRRSSILRELGNSTQRRRGHTPRVSVSSIFQTQPDSPPWSASFGRPKATIGEPELEPEPEPDLDWEEKMQSTRKTSVSSHNSSTFTSLDRIKRPKGRNRDGRRDTSQYIEHLENQLAATLQDAELADANAHAARYKALNAEYRILKQQVTEWEERFEARVQDEETVMAEREAQLKGRIRSLEREVETKDNKIRELEWEIEKDSQTLRTLEAVNATNRSLERRVDVLTELLAQSPRVELPPPPTTTVVDGSSVSNGEAMCRTPRPKSMFTKIPLSPVRQPLFQPTAEPDASFVDPCKRSGNEEDTRSFELASVDSGFDSCSGPSHSQRTSLLSNQSQPLYSAGSGAGAGTGSVTSFPLSPELQLQGKLRYRNRKMRRFPSGCCTLKPLVLPTASAALSPYAPPVTSSSPNSIQQQRLARYFSTLRYSRAGSGYDDSLYDDEMDGDDVDVDAARIDALDSLEGNAAHYQSFEEAMAGHDLSMDDMDDLAESSFAAKSLSPSSDTISYEGGTVRRRRNRSRKLSILRNDIGPVKRITSARPNPPSWLEKLHVYIPQLLANARTLTHRILTNAWHSNWRRLGSLSWWFLGLLLGTHTRNQWFKRSTLRNARCRGYIGEEEMEEISTPVSVNHRPDNTMQLLSGCTPTMQEWLKFSVTLVLAIGLAVRDGPGTLMCPCPLPEADTTSNVDMMAEPEDYPPSGKYGSIRTSLSVLSPSLLPRDGFDDSPD
ncbi:uncharacterized protein GIQ15_03393 [Arthroderma uncinatum]|uniref:uncharacterized protein n=1 Tax=Arthroderma uncinatum TaxID=74035 RepID=UPI00144A4F58|nr:uncharacterized protein GIQ15_03393 [Arthroderma uncinatum]KAF3484069.1 hypothetical protein GIQ15_03393 [Arthroderma uncinatum]